MHKLLTYRCYYRSSDNTFQGLFCLLCIVTGDPNYWPLLPLAGRPSRAFAWWAPPLLGSPSPLLPPPPSRGNATPTSPPRAVALLPHDPARSHGRHLCLLDLPLLLCRPPCRRHLSCWRWPLSGAVDIPVAWGKMLIRRAGC